MQQMDDKTGKPLPVTPDWLLPQNQPLTAAQKEQQREAIVQRLIELTAANNAMYAQVTELLGRAGSLDDALEAHRALSLWGRLRWLVRGV